MTHDLNLFLRAWSGGDEVSEAERQRLLGRLQDDADFRSECVAEMHLLGMCQATQSSTPRWPELFEILEVAEDQAQSPEAFAQSVMEQVTPYKSRGTKTGLSALQWRPLAAAVAGLAMGLFSASIVWAVARPSVTVRSLLMEGFESSDIRSQPRFPEQAGVWQGENVTLLSTETAAEGQSVLQFDPRPTRRISHLNFLLDASALGSLRQNERRELHLTTQVRTIGESPSPHRYTVRLATFSEGPEEIRSHWFSNNYGSDHAVTFASRSQRVSPGEWTTLEAVVPLPPEARFVVLSIGAASLDEATRLEALHQVDAFQLEMTTSPTP